MDTSVNCSVKQNWQFANQFSCSVLDHWWLIMVMVKTNMRLASSSWCSSSWSPCTTVLFEKKRPSPPSSPHRQPLQVQPGDGNSGGEALLYVQVSWQQQGSLPVRHCYLQRCDDDGGVDPKELGNTKNGLGSPKPERSLDINWEGGFAKD